MKENDAMQVKKPRFSLSADMIKLIAVIAMSLDHIGWLQMSLFTVQGQIVHGLGRITMPIMCYYLSVGYVRTSNYKKYLLRLLCFALLSQIPFSLCFSGTAFSLEFNVLFTLALALIVLKLVNEKTISPIVKVGGIALCFYLCSYCDWGYWCLAMSVAFHGLVSRKQGLGIKERNKRIFLILALTALALCAESFFSIRAQYDLYTATHNSFYRACVLLAYLPLSLGDETKRGKPSIFRKYFFYAYYPLHLIILYLIFGL